MAWVFAGVSVRAILSQHPEFAGNEAATKLLLGLGLDELSVSGPSIPGVKSIIRSTSYVEAKALAEKVMDLETADQVVELIKES
ncbi:PEP-utilising enzyme, TIM barrel domain [Alkalispirochaeta americana]|uniref:PEP-utilising enzyme, TIM barrel domain n=1 Tax=Alkalispirochaeta americana TaxID=159291 RepID=A0A1N6SN58_9SPIO|nr:putative PEP-binding protein [Alkalispirochaeta americana]SIQ42555.1 PEP-utilising enzyme, TIM barrel domain [Alkalispirochaeta americana]